MRMIEAKQSLEGKRKRKWIKNKREKAYGQKKRYI